MTPGTYFTFGTKTCTVHRVEIVSCSANGQYGADEKGVIYLATRLFAQRPAALKAAAKYLDRKQEEIDKRQAEIDRRRAFIKQQAGVFA